VDILPQLLNLIEHDSSLCAVEDGPLSHRRKRRVVWKPAGQSSDRHPCGVVPFPEASDILPRQAVGKQVSGETAKLLRT
jgi:hypothetical protein